MEVGPWASCEGAIARGQGKIRSVECRAPVPPMPLTPKETRCSATWHLVVSPSEVVLESVSMSLDVPYGTTFNVIYCDTFSLDTVTGHIHVVRRCGVEWVRSQFMVPKSLVETNCQQQGATYGEQTA